MKKSLLIIFSLIILFSFISKVEAFRDIPAVPIPYPVSFELEANCTSGFEPTCFALFDSLNIAFSSTFSLYEDIFGKEYVSSNSIPLPVPSPFIYVYGSDIVPSGFGYYTDQYNVFMSFDAAENDYGNTTPMTIYSPKTTSQDIGNLNCWNECTGFPSNSKYCGSPSTWQVYSRTVSSPPSRQISCSYLNGGVGYGFLDTVTSNVLVTLCEFGVPLGNQRCPDFPSITAPVSVTTGTAANISWAVQNTRLPGDLSDFISSCKVTSSPNVGEWTALSGSAAPVLNADTTFTLTCTNKFGRDFLPKPTRTVTVTAPVAINGSCGATENLCTAGTPNDIADNATHYLWQCLGENGGIGASCSLVKPVPPPITYDLRVTSSVSSNVPMVVVPGNDGSTTFTNTYNNNTPVVVTAPATASGNNFSNWNGCISSFGTTK